MPVARFPQLQSRYASAAAITEDVRRFPRGEPIAARPESPFERPVRGFRRGPVFTIATLSVIVLAGGGPWIISERNPTERAATAQRETTKQSHERPARNKWPMN